MPRLYSYVGPGGSPIRSCADLERWLGKHRKQTATFVVIDGVLFLADRHSEHIACAKGRAVESAGEMMFEGARVVDVTNQSTGYCPDPESWPAVAAALDAAKIRNPNNFTHAFIFRICSCGQRNIVKDDDFRCGSCDAALPQIHNLRA